MLPKEQQRLKKEGIMNSIKSNFNNLANLLGTEAAHDELLNCLRGEVPLDILDAEEQIEQLEERLEESIQSRREWYRNVLDQEFRNRKLWCQPPSQPQWLDDNRVWAEDPGYFRCQLRYIESLVEESKAATAEKVSQLEAVCDNYFPDHDREEVFVEVPDEGEAYVSYLKDTIDTHDADKLVAAMAVAEDLKAHGHLNVRQFLEAATSITDRLNRKCWDEDSGWYKELNSFKARLKSLKNLIVVPGEETTKGMAPMMPDEAADLIIQAKRMAGKNQSKENVMACLEAILHPEGDE